MRPLALLALLTLLLVALSPRPARACTCTFKTHGEFLVVEDTVLPANARGVAWLERSEGPDDTAPMVSAFKVEELTRERAARTVPHTLARIEPYIYLVAPTTPLRPMHRYRFTGPGKGAPQQVTVTVDWVQLTANRTPSRLVTSPVRTRTLRVSAPASCSTEVRAAQVEVALQHRATGARRESALLYRTLVDGKPDWRPARSNCEHSLPGRSWVGFGKDLIYATCAGSYGGRGLTRGRHTVQLEAVLPGTAVRFVSEVKTVDLVCAP